MVLLKYLGSCGYGSSLSKIAYFFKTSIGAVKTYVRRTVSAVLKHKDTSVFWPDVEERKVISRRIQEEYVFKDCVGIIDGTLFPLCQKPRAFGEDYFCRKSMYAVHSLITCDDVGRIRDAVIGWPGSVHDNRVWKNSYLRKNAFSENRHRFFSEMQYLLGDSAFEASRVMIPAYRKVRGGSLSRMKEKFNTHLAQIRIRSEHCIGLFKARFQYFRGIPNVVETEQDMKEICDLFYCAAILHNWLIVEPENDEDDDWSTDLPDSHEIDGDGDGRRRHDYEGEGRRADMLQYICDETLIPNTIEWTN